MHSLTQANEKYKGDALLQKVYTVDFLSKKKKVNEGEVPQYYVEGNHEAIIEPAVFDRVQELMEARKTADSRNNCTKIFSGKIKCGDCGSWYGSRVWHSNDKYRRVVWQCSRKYAGGKKCTTPHLDEETIRERFIRALNLFCEERDEILAVFAEIKRTLSGMDETDGKRRLQTEMMQNFVDTLEGMPEPVDYFEENAWYALVDFVTVRSRDEIRFTFKNGMEIQV